MENSKNNQHSATLDEVNQNVDGLRGLVEDVLVTVNDFADETRQEFINIRQDMATKQELAEFRMATKHDLTDLESKMATRFVTKDYLDEKLADQTSEIFLRLGRRQAKDKNFKKKLVGVISGHSLITSTEADDLKELI